MMERHPTRPLPRHARVRAKSRATDGRIAETTCALSRSAPPTRPRTAHLRATPVTIETPGTTETIATRGTRGTIATCALPGIRAIRATPEIRVTLAILATPAISGLRVNGVNLDRRVILAILRRRIRIRISGAPEAADVRTATASTTGTTPAIRAPETRTRRTRTRVNNRAAMGARPPIKTAGVDVSAAAGLGARRSRSGKSPR